VTEPDRRSRRFAVVRGVGVEWEPVVHRHQRLGFQAPALSLDVIGANWQRQSAHFLRNLLAVVPLGDADMLAEAIRTIIIQRDAASVHEQFADITTQRGRCCARSAR
jgi:hypothetical protein